MKTIKLYLFTFVHELKVVKWFRYNKCFPYIRWMTLHSILFMVPWPLWVLTANLVSGTRMLEPNWRRLKDLTSLWLPAVSTPKEMCSVMQPAMTGQRLVLPSIKIAIFCQLKISTGGFLFFLFFFKVYFWKFIIW